MTNDLKLSVTTLGCPNWNLETIVARAAEYGYDAVDFRGYLGTMEIFKLPEFTTAAAETLALFTRAGIGISAFSSSARVFAEPEKAVEEVQAYARLCQTFRAPYIRVFGGDLKETPREEAIRVAARTLQKCASIAERHGTQVLLETHDSWTSSRDIQAVMERVAHPAAGVLWDIHHPWRVNGESPAETWAALGHWIRNTHFKDARPLPDGKSQLCLMGRGSLPLAEFVRVLRAGGYAGHYTLEWEKRWHPEIEEPEVAFPDFARFMKSPFF